MLFPLCLLGIEQSVSNDIRTAFALDHEASVLFQKASETIEVELSLKDINRSPGFKRTVSLASLVSSRRMDSDHFLLVFESLQQLLRIKGNTKTLKGALTYNERGQQPIYSQTGYPVIKGYYSILIGFWIVYYVVFKLWGKKKSIKIFEESPKEVKLKHPLIAQ